MPGSSSSAIPSGMLLAVDIGLRTAWALFDRQGRLLRFESRNFVNRTRFRSGVVTVLKTLPTGIEVIVAEGDRKLARLWFECRQDWETQVVGAEHWRREILWPRLRRNGPQAKDAAKVLAARLVREDECGWSQDLNDDTAEAILLGLWAVRGRGWRSTRS